MFSKKINRVRDSELITEEVTSQEVSAKRVYLKIDLNLTFFPIPICVFIYYVLFIILYIMLLTASPKQKNVSRAAVNFGNS